MTIINLCFKKILLLMSLAINFSSLCKASAEHYDNEPIKFKLGFEFQETSGLCKWALNDQEVQKKALFRTLDSSNRKLWKVVIDTNDIEFVTEPFTYQERPRLKGCLESLIGSFQKLEHLLEETPQITFTDWINSLKAPLSAQHYRLKLTKHFPLAENKMIEQPLGWKPRFTPQVTIQHPLEYAIPLYFSLFGFDNPEYTMQLAASLPYGSKFIDSIREANCSTYNNILRGYNTKLGGLMFLHALTLVQMVPSVRERDESDDQYDKRLLNENLDAFEKSYQVDAKMKLTLMSRRPFSEMLKDVKRSLKRQEMNYSAGFRNAMSQNWTYMCFFRVPSEFSNTNYGEQFFARNTSAVQPLQNFAQFIEQEFLEDNRETITALLAQGIITTTMLRHFNENILTSNGKCVRNLFQDFYDEAIESIEYPENKYIINTNSQQIESIDSEVDVLSPPWFLDADNSMGQYIQPLSLEEKQYGEAIVEVRAIKGVSSRFLTVLNLLDNKENYNPNEFLIRTDEQTTIEALKLFDYLSTFATPKNLADISLGLIYAVLKH